MRLKQDATEEFLLCDTHKTYEAEFLLTLKKYLVFYGTARQNVSPDLCEGGIEVRGGYGSKKSTSRTYWGVPR